MICKYFLTFRRLLVLLQVSLAVHLQYKDNYIGKKIQFHQSEIIDLFFPTLLICSYEIKKTWGNNVQHDYSDYS